MGDLCSWVARDIQVHLAFIPDTENCIALHSKWMWQIATRQCTALLITGRPDQLTWAWMWASTARRIRSRGGEADCGFQASEVVEKHGGSTRFAQLWVRHLKRLQRLATSTLRSQPAMIVGGRLNRADGIPGESAQGGA